MPLDRAVAIAGPRPPSAPAPYAPAPPARDPAARRLFAAAQIEEQPAPVLARWTIGLAVLGVAGFVAWAALTPLTQLTVAMGEILPAASVRQVQHLEGGIVAQALAREGDRVRADQPLLVMDDTAPRNELAQNLSRAASLALTIARLEAFARDGEAVLDAPIGGSADIADTQRAIFAAQTEARRDQIAAARAETAARRETLDGAVARVGLIEAQLAQARVAMERRAPLYAQGLLRLAEMEAAEREVLRLETEHAAARSAVVGARHGVAEAEALMGEAMARLRQEALDAVAGAQVELADARAAIHRLEDRLTRLSVPSPVDGVVKQIAARGPGSVLAPGEVVAEIVPDDGAILAEVAVDPAEVGHLRQGMPATVKVATYDFARFGGVEAEIEQISPTTFETPEGPAMFHVRLRLASASVGDPARGMAITPGMTVMADIRTGETTMLNYLLAPLRRVLDHTFTER